MFIDVKRGSEKVYIIINPNTVYIVTFNYYLTKLQVNLDIVFPKMPCPMIGVDIQDVVGSHSLDLGGRLYKRRLDKNGGYLSDQLHVVYFFKIKTNKFVLCILDFRSWRS